MMAAYTRLLLVVALFLFYLGNEDRWPLLETEWSYFQWMKVVLLYTSFIVMASKTLLRKPTRHYEARLFMDERKLRQKSNEEPETSHDAVHVKDTKSKQVSNKPATRIADVVTTQDKPDEDDTLLLTVIPSDQDSGDCSVTGKRKSQLFKEVLLQAKPSDILPALSNILSTSDIEDVKEITRNQGDNKAALRLIEKLSVYDGDFSKTLAALKGPDAGMRAKRTGRKLMKIQQQLQNEEASQIQRDIDKKIEEQRELFKKVEQLKSLEDERERLQKSLQQNEGPPGFHDEPEEGRDTETVRLKLNRINEEIQEIETDLTDHDERLGKCEKGAGQMKTAINWTIKELEKEKKTVSQQQDQQNLLEGFVKEYVKDSQYSGPKHNVKLQKRIWTDFKNGIDPDIAVDLFHKYNTNVLSNEDIERVEAVTVSNGKTRGAMELLKLLVKYEDWFDCLLEVLRDPDVKREDLAEQFMGEEQNILQEQERQKNLDSHLQRKEFVTWLIGMSRHKQGERAYEDGQRNAFHTLTNPWSVNHTVQLAWTENDDAIFKVVDVPIPDESSACSNLAEAMLLCPEGFHALLWVFRSEDGVMEVTKDSIHMLRQQFGEDILSAYVVIILITERKLGDDWLEMQDETLKELLTDCFFLYNLYPSGQHSGAEAGSKFSIQENNVMDLLRYIRWQKHRDSLYTNTHFEEAKALGQRLLTNDREFPREEIMRETCLIIRDLNLLERSDLDLDGIGVILMRIDQNMKRLFREVDDGEDNDLLRGLKKHLATLEKSLVRDKDRSKRNKNLQEQHKKQRDELIEKMKEYHGADETELYAEGWTAGRGDKEGVSLKFETTDREERIHFCYQTKMQVIKQTQRLEREDSPDKIDLSQSLLVLNDDFTKMRKTQREKMRETIGKLIVRLKEQ